MFQWLGLFLCKMVICPLEVVCPGTTFSKLRYKLVVVILIGTYFLVFSVRLRNGLGQDIMQTDMW
jgi:hypothetical protein